MTLSLIVTIIIIIYAISVAVMGTLATVAKVWKDDRENTIIIVFAPIFNTLVILAGIFYFMPQEIIERHKDKEKLKHKHDPRWNLMNNRKK